jgi:hypothetical protein
MQPNNAREVSPQQRYTTLLILWGVFLFNIILFLVLAIIVAPDSSKLAYNRVLVIALTALGTFAALVSIFFRQKMTKQAVEGQRPQSVSSAYIVAFALCEVAALCGVMLRFTTNDPYYYLLFIVSVVGFLLNMPRRDDVFNAIAVKRI